MVIRGPHEYPGAVAVEDEDGRVVQLHKLTQVVTAMLPCQSIAFSSSGKPMTAVLLWLHMRQIPRKGEALRHGAQRREGAAKMLLAKQGSVAAQASRRRSKPEAPGRHGAGKIVYR